MDTMRSVCTSLNSVQPAAVGTDRPGTNCKGHRHCFTHSPAWGTQIRGGGDILEDWAGGGVSGALFLLFTS